MSLMLGCAIFFSAALPFSSVVAADESVTVFQQLFSVKPTLDINDLDRYSNRGILSNNFVRQGVPLLVLGAAIGAGYYYYSVSRNKQSEKEGHSVLRRFVVGGALNALALFVVLNLVGGVITPTSLNSLAIYVDDQLTFQQGDVVRSSFLIQNTGAEQVDGLVFRNPFSSELTIDPTTVLFEKNGDLPEDYRPAVTDAGVYVNIGSLRPGESVSLAYDFMINTENQEDIINTATVTTGTGEIFYSNSATIRRNPLPVVTSSP